MEFPTCPSIGAKIEEFIKRFGEPISVSADGTIVSFKLPIDEASYLTTLNLDGYVYNISFSMKTFSEGNQIGVEIFANEFLPDDFQVVSRVKDTVISIVNADVPISIYEYYAETVKDSKGFLNNESDIGYITIYICHEGNDSRMVVALGREEAIQ